MSPGIPLWTQNSWRSDLKLRHKVRMCVTFLDSKHCGSAPPATWHGKHWREQPPGVMENSHKLNQQILLIWSWNSLKLFKPITELPQLLPSATCSTFLIRRKALEWPQNCASLFANTNFSAMTQTLLLLLTQWWC